MPPSISNVNFFRPPLTPCSYEEHEPFRVIKNIISIPYETNSEIKNRESIIGTVQTSSWNFNGDRTDLNDTWSLCWAAFLRSFGVVSPYLVAESGYTGIPGEISARHLFCSIPAPLINEKEAIKSFQAWAAMAFHLLDDVFDWRATFSGAGKYHWEAGIEQLAPWLPKLLKEIGQSESYNFVSRRKPNWVYYSDFKKNISIVRMARPRMLALQIILAFKPDNSVKTKKSYCIVERGIPNAIPIRTFNKGLKYLDICEGKTEHRQVIPLENACLFLGERTLITIYKDCSAERFYEEKEAIEKNRKAENLVFFSNAKINWKENPNPNDMESLAADLLSEEAGVVSVKQVGATNDRDGGKDLIINVLGHGSDEQVKEHRVLVQVKCRAQSVGKRDVQDIRDTVDHHDADGYLLLAYPRITSQLFDNLDKMKTTKRFYIDWWIKQDWEERLRRLPHIAQRYPSVLTLEP